MPILDHEHDFQLLAYWDQTYLTDDQKTDLKLDPKIHYYTNQVCIIGDCTATKLDSTPDIGNKTNMPVVDLDAVKLSRTGEV